MSTQFSSKPIGSILWCDLEQLVSSHACESLVLDFKREFPAQDKPMEFAKDVLGMANASGGYLVYGISDGGGSAGKLSGLGVRSEVQRIVDVQMMLLAKYAAPKIYGVRYQIVESSSGECAVIVRVPSSAIAPHALRSNVNPESLTYHIRTLESHIRTMPEEEVRRRYVAASDSFARVERVRMSAFYGIGQPLISAAADKWVQVKCSFIPIGRQELGTAFAVNQLREAAAKLRFKDGLPGQHPVPVMQGLFVSRDSIEGLGQFWLLQRDGSFVWIDTSTHTWFKGHERPPAKPFFPRYENELAASLSGLSEALKQLEITNPIAVCLSISNAMGAAVPADPAFRFGGKSCLHDEVHAPAIVIDSHELLTKESIKPAFDVIMNAFGIDKSVAT